MTPKSIATPKDPIFSGLQTRMENVFATRQANARYELIGRDGMLSAVVQLRIVSLRSSAGAVISEMQRAGMPEQCMRIFNAKGQLRVAACGDEILFVEHVWVRPDLRGKGIGRQLLIAVLAQTRQLRPIVLWPCPEDGPHRKTALRAMYRSMGFVALPGTALMVHSGAPETRVAH